MITRIKIKRYKILKDIDIKLRPFQILVGPNGCGKSTALDAFEFLADLVKDDLNKTIEKRAYSLQDLIWNRKLEKFDIEIEAKIPEDIRKREKSACKKLKYTLTVGFNRGKVASILKESLIALPSENAKEREIFKREGDLLLFHSKFLRKRFKGSPAEFRIIPQSERSKAIFSYITNSIIIRLLDYSFPTWWFGSFISSDITKLHLNPEAMKKPCPPGQPKDFLPDGSNIARVIKDFEKENRERFRQWLEHLKIIIPEIQRIDIKERPEDRSSVLYLKYPNVTVPSWNISDGTLRAMALTLIPYLAASEKGDKEQSSKIILIDEPENGVHPKILEGIYQSLSSAYNWQIICATHSPIFLAFAEPKDLLCMNRDSEGAATIIPGDKHFALKKWKKDMNIGMLLAAGILE